jgi:hypothetical protein
MNRLATLVLPFLCMAMPSFAGGVFREVDPATLQRVDDEVGKLIISGFGGCPPAKIEEFGRYYGVFTDNSGRTKIVGQLRSLKVLRAQAGIHTLDALGVDGGCYEATVSFEIGTLKLSSANWGGR